MYAGLSSWRLPTIEELSSTLDKTNYPKIHPSFKNIIDFGYWSSTKHKSFEDFFMGLIMSLAPSPVWKRMKKTMYGVCMISREYELQI